MQYPGFVDSKWESNITISYWFFIEEFEHYCGSTPLANLNIYASVGMCQRHIVVSFCVHLRVYLCVYVFICILVIRIHFLEGC